MGFGDEIKEVENAVDGQEYVPSFYSMASVYRPITDTHSPFKVLLSSKPRTAPTLSMTPLLTLVCASSC